jgi:hypothetical protein
MKPYAAVIGLKLAILGSMAIWYSIITREPVEFKSPILVFLPIIFVIALADYNYFLSKSKYKQFFKEFEVLDRKTKGGGVLVFLLVVGVMALLFFSFFVLSKTDFSTHED